MSRAVVVRRTGGFAGLTSTGEVDLDAGDERGPELAGLLERIDDREVTAVKGQTSTHADRYTYDFDLCGRTVSVPEQHLTDDLRRVAELVLGA